MRLASLLVVEIEALRHGHSPIDRQNTHSIVRNVVHSRLFLLFVLSLFLKEQKGGLAHKFGL